MMLTIKDLLKIEELLLKLFGERIANIEKDLKKLKTIAKESTE